jgi:Cu/Zn superoxide dismutase
MAKLVGIVGVVVALAVVGAALAASTTTYSYRATLSSKNEVPAPTASAKAAGVFTATVTDKQGKASIRWTLTFRRLSGKAVAAHIHKGAAGVAGPVVVPLCGPCRNGQNARQAIDHDLAEALEKGGYYVNVHTAKNQGGEVRGQLKLVGG